MSNKILGREIGGAVYAGPLAFLLNIPVFSGLVKALELAGNFYLDWARARAHKDWIEQVQLLEPLQLVESLPEALAEDLEEQLRNGSGRDAHLDRCVVFFDTFEALWESPHWQTEARWHEADEWVRSLCRQTSRALVVVGGQDPLRWAEQDFYWAEGGIVRHHPLRGFEEPQSALFLRQVGIKDKSLLTALHELTDGHPLYLAWVAETVASIRAQEGREATAADFTADERGRGEKQLLDRLLRWLPSDEHRRALEALSLAPWFDQAINARLSRTTGIPEGVFRDLAGHHRHDLVQDYAGVPGAMTLLALVRRLLRAQVPADQRRILCQALSVEFAGRVDHAEVGERVPFLVAQLSCLTQVDPDRAYQLLSRSVAQAMEEWRLDVAEALLVAFGQTSLDSRLTGKWKLEWGRLYLRREKHGEAKESLEEAIRSFDEVLRNDDQDVETWHLRGLALRRHAGALWNQGRLPEAVGACDEAIRSCERAIAIRPDYGEALVNQANAAWQKASALRDLGGREQLGEALATCKEGLRCCDRALQVSNGGNVDAWNERCLVLETMAEALDDLADYEGAIGACKQAVECCDHVLDLMPAGMRKGKVWNDRGLALETMAEALLKLGSAAEAVAACQRAIESFDAVLKETGERQTEASNNRSLALETRAEALLEADRQPEALKACEEALAAFDRMVSATGHRDAVALSNRARALRTKAQALQESPTEADRMQAIEILAEARRDFDRACALTPEDTVVRIHRATTSWMQARGLLERGELGRSLSLLNEAKLDCEEAKQDAKGPDPGIWTTLGWIGWVQAAACARQAKWPEAVDCLGNAHGYFTRALALTDNRLREANRGLTETARTAEDWSTLGMPSSLAPRLRRLLETGIHARLCVSDDLNRILEIEAGSFDDDDAYPRTQFQELLIEHPDGFFVAEARGHVVGYVVGYVEGELGEVDSLAVEPAARRTGVGRALMEHVLEHLASAGARVCSLEVRSGNESAIRFYEALGFHAAGRRHAYYVDGGDAVIMERAL